MLEKKLTKKQKELISLISLLGEKDYLKIVLDDQTQIIITATKLTVCYNNRVDTYVNDSMYDTIAYMVDDVINLAELFQKF